jgi:hypothetical protein
MCKADYVRCVKRILSIGSLPETLRTSAPQALGAVANAISLTSDIEKASNRAVETT